MSAKWKRALVAAIVAAAGVYGVTVSEGVQDVILDLLTVEAEQ